MLSLSWKRRYIGLLAIFVLLFSSFSSSAKELARFERLLNQVEMSFWRAIFAPENSETRSRFRATTQNLLQCAQDIKSMQNLNRNIRSYGDLIGGSAKLTQMVTSHSAYRKKRISVSGMKRTDINSFRRSWRPASDSGKRLKNIPVEEISVDEYREFLNETVEKNLSSLSKKFNSKRDYSYTQREMLRKTAENFYSTMVELRIAVLRMRKFDPLFKPAKKGVAK